MGCQRTQAHTVPNPVTEVGEDAVSCCYKLPFHWVALRAGFVLFFITPVKMLTSLLCSDFPTESRFPCDVGASLKGLRTLGIVHVLSKL